MTGLDKTALLCHNQQRKSTEAGFLPSWKISESFRPHLIFMSDLSTHLSIPQLLEAATAEAADALQSLSLSSPDKETRKEAKRALYRLKQKGISPAEVSHGGASFSSFSPIAQTLATVMDGAGNQLLWFVFTDLHGGSPTLFSALVSDETGVKDFVASRMTRTQIQEQVQSSVSSEHEGVSFAEVGLDHGRARLLKAQEINRRLRKMTPKGFLEWAQRVGTEEAAEAESPVWSRMSRESLENDPDLDRSPETFFETPLFSPWFLDVDSVANWTMGWAFANGNFAELTEKFDRETVLRECIAAMITPDLIERYRDRLTETAYILQLSEQTDLARRALAFALALERASEPAEQPFLRALIERSLDASVEMLQHQIEEQTQPQSQGAQSLP